MKKFLIPVGFFLALGLLYWWLTAPRRSPVYVSPTENLSAKKNAENRATVLAHVAVINERNAKVKSIVASDVSIKVQSGLTVKVSGEMAMEKEKRFRMRVRSLVGLEMDIGSNDTHFWFWSRRMNPPALHYAKHEDLSKTMLKTPLNPTWMMESMNVGLINADKAEFARFKDYWAIFQQRLSDTTQEQVTVVTLIDPQKNAVIGRYLYNAQGKMIASTEVREFYLDSGTGAYIPRSLLVIWYAEGVIMEWNLGTPQVNVGIDPRNWVMPNMRNKIDMGNGK